MGLSPLEESGTAHFKVRDMPTLWAPDGQQGALGSQELGEWVTGTTEREEGSRREQKGVPELSYLLAWGNQAKTCLK